MAASSMTSRRDQELDDFNPFESKRKRPRDDVNDASSNKNRKKKVTFDTPREEGDFDILRQPKSHKTAAVEAGESDPDDPDEDADLLEESMMSHLAASCDRSSSHMVQQASYTFLTFKLERKRRGQVNLEFSDDEDDALKLPNQNDDMFADTNADKKEEPVKRKGVINYMRPSDIEGQEWEGDVDDYDEDGVKIEPFNMDQELEEG